MYELKILRQLLQASCPKDQLSARDIAVAPTKLPIYERKTLETLNQTTMGNNFSKEKGTKW
jgi:hypothetical protein